MALASAGRLGLAPRGEEPLGRVPVTAAMRFFLALAAGTILSCYAIATHLGHVRVFLPMISDCFVNFPEAYVSRAGLPAAGMGLMGVILAVAGMLEKRAASLPWARATLAVSTGAGLLGAAGMIAVGAVSEKDNDNLHCFVAAVFFVLFPFCMVGFTWNLQRHDAFAHAASRNLKYLIIFLDVVCTVVVGMNGLHDSRTEAAIFEWAAVMLTLAWYWTMVYEMEAMVIVEVAERHPAEDAGYFALA